MKSCTLKGVLLSAVFEHPECEDEEMILVVKVPQGMALGGECEVTMCAPANDMWSLPAKLPDWPEGMYEKWKFITQDKGGTNYHYKERPVVGKSGWAGAGDIHSPSGDPSLVWPKELPWNERIIERGS